METADVVNACVAVIAVLIAGFALYYSRRATRANEAAVAEARRAAGAAEVANARTAEEAELRAYQKDAPVFVPEVATFTVGSTAARFVLRLTKAGEVVRVTAEVGGADWMGFAAGDTGYSSSDAVFDSMRPGDTVEGSVRRIEPFGADEVTAVLPLTLLSDSDGDRPRQWEEQLVLQLRRDDLP